MRYQLAFSHNTPAHAYIRRLLKTEENIKKVSRIRKSFINEKIKFAPVYSSIGMLEYVSWYSNIAFREAVTYAVGAHKLRRSGDKEIGNYIAKALQQTDSKYEDEKLEASDFWGATFPHTGHLKLDTFKGLFFSEIHNFKMGEPWHEYGLAYRQVGGADIMHLLFAKHLGCEYFITADNDFKRCKEMIHKEFGIKTINYDELISLI
jgi:hypothetical protein